MAADGGSLSPHRVPGGLDSIDIDLIEAISASGPRNLNMIAKKVAMPPRTARYRVDKMFSKQTLFVHVNPYHTNMGLRKAVVFAEAVQGYEDLLLRSLALNKFWIYLFRCYGPYEGCGGIWTVPDKNTREYEDFLNTIERRGLAEKVHLHWSTCFQSIPVRKTWFKEEGVAWALNWGEWITEIQEIEGELPYTLKDPGQWPTNVDYLDLLIIKELEKDATISMRALSRTLQVSEETIKYHFQKHVLRRGLIESFQAVFYRFPPAISETLFFLFEFGDYASLTKFALSLLDKPFVTTMGKILEKPSLVAQVYLPKVELRNFVRTLSTLVREGLLKRYAYVFQDINQSWRQTIPYEFFQGTKWNYDHSKHLEDLDGVVRNSEEE